MGVRVLTGTRAVRLRRYRPEHVRCHSDRFCVCRADGSLVRYNKRAAELWGRAPRLGDPTEQSGASFRRYGPDGEPLHFDSTPVVRTLRAGDEVIGAELVIERPDGSRVPVLMNVAPLKEWIRARRRRRLQAFRS